MQTARIPFKRVISFQTISCVSLALLAVLISLIGVVRVKPVYDFDNYFSEQNAADRDTDAVTEAFDIGFIDVLAGIPQISEAIHFDGGEFLEYDEYGSRIRDYLEESDLIKKQKLTMYVYLTFNAFDENMFAGALLLVQLFAIVFLPLISVLNAAYVLIRFYIDRKNDYFTCYQDVQRRIKPIVKSAFLVFAMTALLPNITLSWTGVLLFVSLCVFAAFNAACVRLKEYTYAQKKYLTVLQIGSLVNIASVLVFWIGLMTSCLLESLTEICKVDTWELFEAVISFSGEMSIDFEEIFTATLIAVFLWFALSSHKLAAQSVFRAFCNTQKKRYGNIIYESTFIKMAVPPIFGILLLCLFLVNNEGLKLSGGELAGFIVTAAGALLMVLSEMSVKFLIGTLCIDLGQSGADNVLGGDVYDRRENET